MDTQTVGRDLEAFLESEEPSQTPLMIYHQVVRGNDEYVLEPTIIWRVPLLDPARWEAVIGALLGSIVVILTLRLTLMIVVHDDEKDDDEREVMERKKE